MKKKVTITITLLVLIFIGVLVSINFKKEESSFKEKDYSSNASEQIVGENTLSMMLETSAGSGEYEKTTQSSWPTSEYTFNATLSKCENGSELSWDDENKIVSMSGNMSDKCYVYFDKLPFYLANWVIEQYNGTQGNNNIYYHNSSLTNGAGDNSYRYAGASPDNYICFDTTCTEDTLYRIIGVFNNQVKVIKATSIGKYAWDSNESNTWSTSSLYKYLNGLDTNEGSGYIDSISSFSSKIASSTWKVGGVSISSVTAATMYTNEMNSTATGTDNKTEISAQIGLMYASDYGFAASPTAWGKALRKYSGNDSAGTAIKTINWLYLGSDEWLVSRGSGYSFDSLYVDSDGCVDDNHTGVDLSFAVRPVFYLESSVIYSSGSGGASNPIRVV